MNSPLVNDSFYHVFNRGVEKRIIFTSASDCHRFLQTLDFYRFYPTPRKLSTHLNFKQPPVTKGLAQKSLVKTLAFCLMPNHFHLLLQQLEEKGISEFLRRISDSYTRYFNTKNDRVGPLLQGKFKAKVITKDEYLLQLSKYIHRNPVKLKGWSTNLKEYSFSSYPGYLDPRRKYSFCETEMILSYFSKHNSNLSYQSFVEETEGIAIPDNLFTDGDAHA